MKKVVLVTGSSGLIGRAVCHYLGNNNYEVIGFDRQGPPYPPPETDCIFADISSDESLQSAFHIIEHRHGSKIHAVVHLAAYYSFESKESELYDKVTVQGTNKLLYELKRFAVDQFIFCSSMLIHAPTQPGEKINEHSIIRPTWGYPRSKVETEKLILRQHGRTPVVVLRVAGVYSDVCQSIPIAHQIERIYENQLISHFYPGQLDTRQSFVHLDDLVECIAAVIEKKDQLDLFSVLLVGEEKALSFQELQNEFGRLIYGYPWPTYYIPPIIAKAGAMAKEHLPGKKSFIKSWMINRASDNYELDCSLAKKQLNWSAKHSLKNTIPKMIEGLQIDPIRWYEINKLHMPTWLKQKQHYHHLHTPQH